MENKKGMYRGGNVYCNYPNVEVYEVANRLDLWPSGNQEVEFVLKGGKAIVRLLGRIYSHDEADRVIKAIK
jgi:hypothetical protein